MLLLPAGPFADSPDTAFILNFFAGVIAGGLLRQRYEKRHPLAK